MNKSNLARLTAALTLGLISIYAVWTIDDSSTVKHISAVITVQNKIDSSGTALNKSKEAVSISPFEKYP